MKWIATISGTTLLLILASLATWGQPGEMQTDSIAAVVNGEVITRSDLEAVAGLSQLFQVLFTQFLRFGQVLYSTPEGEALLRVYQLDVLEQLIDNELLIQQATAHHIEVDPAVVEEQVSAHLSQVMEQNQITMDQLSAALEEQGSSLEAYKERLAASYHQRNQVQILYDEITQTAEVDEDAVLFYYEEHTYDFAGKDGSVTPFEEVKDQIWETLRSDAQSNVWKMWFNRVKEEAEIEVFL